MSAAGTRVGPARRRRERLEEVAELIAARGGTTNPVVMDVTDADSILAGIAEAENATIKIAVNKAGVPDARRAHKMPVELIDRVIDTNLRGPYIVACDMARWLMAAGPPGRIIININCIAPGGSNSEMMDG